jgi:hypothetical protein
MDGKMRCRLIRRRKHLRLIHNRTPRVRLIPRPGLRNNDDAA